MAIGKRILLIISGFIFIIIMLYMYINGQFQAVEPSSQKDKFIVDIAKGSTVSEISKLLKEKQLIKKELVFKLYLKYNGYDDDIKAGKYELAKNMEIKEITRRLIDGDSIQDVMFFTIPEGYNVNQIAEKLEKQGLIDKERFLKLVKDGDFDYDFIKEIPNNKNIIYKLEGYLFPDTYEVKKGATEEEIILKMLSQFKNLWKPEWNKIIAKKNMDIHQIITLASIIEREVVVDKERPIVAGVLYNRLMDNWNLQVDATVQYILEKQKEQLLYDDLKIEHPYNTYINPSLPPGPISNPGILSIEAVIFPENNPYYFYVTKKDNSGEHYFSITYSEQLRNKARSKENVENN